MRNFCATLSIAAFLLQGPAQGASQENAAFAAKAGTLQAWNPTTRPVVRMQVWKAKTGDDLNWSLPEFDDRSWDTLTLKPQELFPNEGNTTRFTWFRTTLRLDAVADTLNPLFIRILFLPGSHEYFWDGVKIGESERSSAGVMVFMKILSLPIPSRLCAPGEHRLAVRTVPSETAVSPVPQIRLGRLRELQFDTHRGNFISLFLIGAFSITGIFYLLSFLARVQRTYLLFSLLCFSAAALSFPWIALAYSGLDQIIIAVLATAVAVISLPLFFLFEFGPFPKKPFPAAARFAVIPTVILGFVILWTLPPGVAAETGRLLGMLVYPSVAICLALAARAVSLKLEGSVEALLGLGCLLVAAVVSHLQGVTDAWRVGLAALILIQNRSLSRRWTWNSLARQESRLRAARLEIELLKKNIQPHFLIHSLRSITHWLEEEPRGAARLVNALADELRMMLKMTGDRIVPLTEEIQLCRAHLAAASLRRRRMLSLEVEGPEDSGSVPPMVLHSLLELGLEKTRDADHAIAFRLRIHSDRSMRLVLFHDAETQWYKKSGDEDTALAYVKARLEEAFPGRWRFRYCPSALGDGHETRWQAEIEISGRS